MLSESEKLIGFPAVFNMVDFYLIHKSAYNNMKNTFTELVRKINVLEMQLEAEEARWKDHVLESLEERG